MTAPIMVIKTKISLSGCEQPLCPTSGNSTGLLITRARLKRIYQRETTLLLLNIVSYCHSGRESKHPRISAQSCSVVFSLKSVGSTVINHEHISTLLDLVLEKLESCWQTCAVIPKYWVLNKYSKLTVEHLKTQIRFFIVFTASKALHLMFWHPLHVL